MHTLEYICFVRHGFGPNFQQIQRPYVQNTLQSYEYMSDFCSFLTYLLVLFASFTTFSFCALSDNVSFPRIALYSCNFGNYRNEILKVNSIKRINQVDYFFYTDKNFTSMLWNVICPARTSYSSHMNSNRFQAKIIRYLLQKELQIYDYAVYVDSKSIAVRRFNQYFELERIRRTIELNPDVDIFVRYHSEYPSRVKDIYGEIDRVVRMKKENKTSAYSWKSYLVGQNWTQKGPFIDFDIFIRKVSSKKLNKMLLDTLFLGLESNFLQRDQVVLLYFLQNRSYNVSYKVLSTKLC